MSSRAVYKGSRRKLVLAFDVGTTFSGISYSILDPGQIPVIKGVTRFPSHEKTGGTSKIPTIIYYSKKGEVQAVGAEATCDGIGVAAEDGNWFKAEWFKLHLRSKVVGEQNILENIPPLPPNKTAVQVFADFLQYLFHCASRYIQDSHVNGANLWEAVKGDIVFVLSHPNGWEGKEQGQMCRAAVLAGLIPDDLSGHSRLSFVTEGEASLHFAIQNGVLLNAMAKGEGVVIVDAGGGTIDISSYRRNMQDVNKAFEEIAVAQCLLSGSVFVNVYATKFLTSFLEDSSFSEDVDHIVHCFDMATKPRFKNADEPQYVKFGSTRDNDPTHNIRFGQLKLAGSDVAQFFTPSVNSIIKAVLELQNIFHDKISQVIMVGGFSASDWLFDNVSRALTKAQLGLSVVRPEEHVNKAVSDGAVSFFLDHFVRARVSKAAYGQICGILYDPCDAEHVKRKASIIISASGRSHVNHYFQVILPKNTQVAEAQEFRRPFNFERFDRADFKTSYPTISCYRGSTKQPQWRDIEPDKYTTVCKVKVDLSPLPSVSLVNESGKPYYRVDYDVIVFFGLTEMKAQVAWKENGVEKRSPATIIYDADAL
ncbi:hypothetical protein GALMADRAFT_255622 [Galerina marginata CBS 339.88]|uniref:Heat shock 70 kDa protein 12A n=1 Tax=Galerina marginata (strain CBS 339.88) TaxID=685588 RepID=A0A067SSP6_GALM3|nr:hypothetical protein GALMADRAFT_255622 [Galerina marginata CBS 339.88]